MKSKKSLIQFAITILLVSMLSSACMQSKVKFDLKEVAITQGNILISKKNVKVQNDSVYIYKDGNVVGFSKGAIRKTNRSDIWLVPGEYTTMSNRKVIIHSKKIVRKEFSIPFIILIFVLSTIVAIILGFYFFRAGQAFLNGVIINPRVLISIMIYKVPMQLIIDTIVEAKKAGIVIKVKEIKDMFLAKVEVQLIVASLIRAKNNDLDLTIAQLQKHYLAGGHVDQVVQALIEAKNADLEMGDRARLNLNFQTAANIDLAGTDIAKSVSDVINYMVVESDDIKGIPLDGVELMMKCKVTLRPIINKIIGEAGYETVLARIAEGIETAIGNSREHIDVLQSPHKLAEGIELNPKITEKTAYELISVDISDIRVGKDVHAELQIEQSKAKKANAEAQNLQAVAVEQEMKAKSEEAKSKVIEAEVEVQKAMAAAFLDGNLSVHDYHNVMNKEADTSMRKAFAKTGSHHNEKKLDKTSFADDSSNEEHHED